MKCNQFLGGLALSAVLVAVSSCTTPKNIAYFQDLNQNPDTVITLQNKTITLKPADRLYIGVKSKDPQISQLFSLMNGNNSSSMSSLSKDAFYYTVDSHGNIDFPVLGTIAVGGLTREQVAEKIKSELLRQSLVKDPVVTVTLSNLHYSVMGEVSNPGQYDIDDEKVTILDAISKAGDLTIQGRRNDVMVLRQEDGHQKIYKVDLCSGKNIFSSPATICSRMMWCMSRPMIPRSAVLRSMATRCRAQASGCPSPRSSSPSLRS